MPRQPRISPDGSIHHVINRGNRRERLFHKPRDYDAFVDVLGEALDHVAMRILAYTVMPNHFHLVLWPEDGCDLSAYMQWVMNAHIRRYHRHYGTSGLGHLYQGRFKNFLIQSDRHLYNVLRYVEGNALRANLVRNAGLWRWSSLNQRSASEGRYLTEWPVPRPPDWQEFVNERIPSEELQRLRLSSTRGAPYGDDEWVKRTVKEYGLESTINTRGRRRSSEIVVEAPARPR